MIIVCSLFNTVLTKQVLINLTGRLKSSCKHLFITSINLVLTSIKFFLQFHLDLVKSFVVDCLPLYTFNPEKLKYQGKVVKYL